MRNASAAGLHLYVALLKPSRLEDERRRAAKCNSSGCLRPAERHPTTRHIIQTKSTQCQVQLRRNILSVLSFEHVTSSARVVHLALGVPGIPGGIDETHLIYRPRGRTTPPVLPASLTICIGEDADNYLPLALSTISAAATDPFTAQCLCDQSTRLYFVCCKRASFPLVHFNLRQPLYEFRWK